MATTNKIKLEVQQLKDGKYWAPVKKYTDPEKLAKDMYEFGKTNKLGDSWRIVLNDK